jgi:hypothetical protein
MIYLIGMSHMVSLLQAVSAADAGVGLHNWHHQAAERFFPIEVKPGMLPGDALRALIISSQDWTPLAKHSEQGGQRMLWAHQGFIEALRPLQQEQQEPQEQQGNTLVSFLHGNGHAAISLLQHPVPFDFVLPGHEDLGMLPGFQPVSHELIRKQLMPYQVTTIAALSMMRMLLPTMRIVHVLPPPPSSEAQIRSKPELFASRMESGVTPLSIRIKYYLLANRLLREAMHNHGVEMLEAPPDSVAADGSLRDQLSGGATHGNPAYGELLAAQLRALS